MIDSVKYDKKFIKNLMKNVNTIHYIGFESYPPEKFKQICINRTYVPYIISSYGRLFSMHFSNKLFNIHQLKTNTNHNTGYERITITYGDMINTLSIHRLVAKAFIPNPENKPEVNHIDGVKTHNYVWNLEWITGSENTVHAFEIGLKKVCEDNPRSIYTNNQVRYVCKLLEENIPLKDIMKLANVSEDLVRDVIRKKGWIKISKDYDFSDYNYGKMPKSLYFGKLKHACEMLEANKSFNDIKQETELDGNMITKLLHKRIYKDMMTKYDFSDYNYGKI